MKNASVFMFDQIMVEKKGTVKSANNFGRKGRDNDL